MLAYRPEIDGLRAVSVALVVLFHLGVPFIPGCSTTLDGEFLYRDAGHLRRNLPSDVRKKLTDKLGLKAALERAVRPPLVSKPE